jgi:hypothetical protein
MRVGLADVCVCVCLCVCVCVCVCMSVCLSVPAFVSGMTWVFVCMHALWWGEASRAMRARVA